MFGTPHFLDRDQAGRRLGEALSRQPIEGPVIVLALPRGGVPVAARVAEELRAPLDILVVRKLGVPRHEELAMGAIASGGGYVLNHDVIRQLGITTEQIEHVVALEQEELRRREAEYRGRKPFPDVAGHTVILVDDGAATGASMRVAVEALRQLGPRAIIAAVPVASREAAEMLDNVADRCTCIIEPDPFYGVGVWYGDFSEVSDGEVRLLLGDAGRRWEKAAPILV